jgi:hypothetical protein
MVPEAAGVRVQARTARARPFMVTLTLERGRAGHPVAGRESCAQGHWFANAPG